MVWTRYLFLWYAFSLLALIFALFPLSFFWEVGNAGKRMWVYVWASEERRKGITLAGHNIAVPKLQWHKKMPNKEEGGGGQTVFTTLWAELKG